MKARLLTPRGFALVELLAVVAAIAVLSSVGFITVQNAQRSAKNQKLLTDVVTINNAVMLYRANGGNLTGVGNATEVLNRLKSRANSASRSQMMGMRDNFLDERVVPVWQSSAEASTSMSRALWNGTNFVITTNGTLGIKEFVFDETASLSTTTENRTATMASTESGWLWSYSDNATSGNRTAIDPALGVTPGGVSVSVNPDFRGVLEVGPTGEVGVGYGFREAGYSSRLALVSLEGMENFDLTTAAGRNAFMIELVRRVVERDRGQVIIDASQQTAGSSMNTYYFRPGDMLVPVLIPNGTFQTAYNNLLAGTYNAQTFPLTSLNMGTDQAPFYQRQVASLGNSGFAIEDMAGGGDQDYNDMIFTLAGLQQNENSQFHTINPTTYYKNQPYWNTPISGRPSIQQSLLNLGILP